MFKKLFSILSFCLLLTGCTDFFSIPEGQLNLDAEILAEKNFCIAFYSTKKFTLSTNQTSKSWNGTLYYSTDTLDWYEWDGSKITAGDTNTIYLRGKDNTFITGEESNNHFVLDGKKSIFSCGNILNILNFPEVQNNTEPFMDVYCFRSLFKSNLNLETAPKLPALQLNSYCYSQMFENCRNLKKAPELPARVLTKGCYSKMFSYCTSLETPPVLKSENLAENCYEFMFYASGLKNSPELPAKTIFAYSYSNMFALCNNLTLCPELKAMTLSNNCYESMFSECANIQMPPELPAYILAPCCYKKMFYKCTSLIELPLLYYQTAAEDCYQSMFENCTSIKLYTETISDNSWTISTNIGSENLDKYSSNMLKNTSGGFTGTPRTFTKYYYADTNFEKQAKEKNCLVFLATDTFELIADKLWNGTLYYSFDADNWNEWDGSAIQSEDGINKTVIYLRGEHNTHITGNINVNGFRFNQKDTFSNYSFYIKCYGNIETLLDYKKVENNIHPKMDDYCFCKLFQYRNNSIYIEDYYEYLFYNLYNDLYKNNLIIAPELPATELSKGCYAYMFKDTDIQKAPELPATKLADECYSYMFFNCTSLNKIPELPAIKLKDKCYSGMFTYCRNIDGAETNLNFTSAATQSCKYMFAGSGLKEAPELPATTIERECYSGMFSYCDLLEKAPLLPAKEIKYRSYADMFSYCDSLTYVPDINADTVDVQGCMEMFYSCTNLENAPALNIKEMTKNIYPQNIYTFFNNSHGCFESMFENCTSLKNVPEIPIKALSKRAYYRMFANCTSLETPPVISAENLAEYCCCQMFEGCTSLKSPANIIFNQNNKPYCFMEMFKNCTSLTIDRKSYIYARSLSVGCYYGTFEGCTSIKSFIHMTFCTIRWESIANMYKNCTGLKITTTKPTNGNYVMVHFNSVINIPKIENETDLDPELEELIKNKGVYTLHECVKDIFAGTSGSFKGDIAPKVDYYCIY